MRKAAALISMFCLTYATGLQAAVLASFPHPAQQQDNYQQDPNQYNQDPNQYNQDYDQDYYQNNGYENYSPDQLDNLLAPIALYPDPLLAQVLPAATFVDQIDEASRYVRSYGQNGIDDQDWDVSVKAVAHYPAVLDMMADKIDWTTALGQAYVNQSTDVMISVQRLRRLASDQGNLITNQRSVAESRLRLGRPPRVLHRLEWRRLDRAFARLRAHPEHGVCQQPLHQHHDQPHGGQSPRELQQHESLQQHSSQRELQQFEPQQRYSRQAAGEYPAGK